MNVFLLMFLLRPYFFVGPVDLRLIFVDKNRPWPYEIVFMLWESLIHPITFKMPINFDNYLEKHKQLFSPKKIFFMKIFFSSKINGSNFYFHFDIKILKYIKNNALLQWILRQSLSQTISPYITKAKFRFGDMGNGLKTEASEGHCRGHEVQKNKTFKIKMVD